MLWTTSTKHACRRLIAAWSLYEMDYVQNIHLICLNATYAQHAMDYVQIHAFNRLNAAKIHNEKEEHTTYDTAH